MSTVTQLSRLPDGYLKYGPSSGRQAYWEIPYALRHASLLEEKDPGSWAPGPLLLEDHMPLLDWINDNTWWIRKRWTPRDLFLVGERAEEFAAAAVLDLSRSSKVWKEDLIAWSDSGQVIRAQRDNRADREILEWLEDAKILVFSLPEVDDRQYVSALNRLLATRAKKSSQVLVCWATPEMYEKRAIHKFGEPYRV